MIREGSTVPRKSRGIRFKRFVKPEPLPETPIDDLVEDGILIAVAGIRMTVRNLIIVRALRDGANYDEGWYIDAVRHEFRALAAEKRADGARVVADHAAATRRRGIAAHQSDYRRGDLRALDRRAAALILLAERLDELSADEDAASSLAQTSRAAALDDIADAMRPELAHTNETETAEYRDARAERMALVGRDLAMLQLSDPAL